jgi:hypothetical protein
MICLSMNCPPMNRPSLIGLSWKTVKSDGDIAIAPPTLPVDAFTLSRTIWLGIARRWNGLATGRREAPNSQSFLLLLCRRHLRKRFNGAKLDSVNGVLKTLICAQPTRAKHYSRSLTRVIKELPRQREFRCRSRIYLKAPQTPADGQLRHARRGFHPSIRLHQTARVPSVSVRH